MDFAVNCTSWYETGCKASSQNNTGDATDIILLGYGLVSRREVTNENDWLKSRPLGSISASGYIDNLA